MKSKYKFLLLITFLILIIGVVYNNFNKKSAVSEFHENNIIDSEFLENDINDSESIDNTENTDDLEKLEEEIEKNHLSVSRMEKMSVLEKEDGWYNYFLITYLKDIRDKYNYNGCSLKYTELEDYNILFLDQNDNIIGRTPAHPTLAVSEKSKNGVMERDEVRDINEFFYEKQFNNKITIKDLNNLTLHNFSNTEIVSLFNEAVDTEYISEFGKYEFNDCQIIKEKKGTDYKIQIGLLMSWGRFKVVRIDVLYDNNVYLSDLINSGKATAEQKQIYNSFNEIENYLIEKQEVNISKVFSKYNNSFYKRLFSLIKSLGE